MKISNGCLLFLILIVIFIVFLLYLNSPCQKVNYLKQEQNNNLGLYLQFNEKDFFRKNGIQFVCDLSGNKNNGKVQNLTNYLEKGISGESFGINGLNSVIIEDSKKLSPVNFNNQFTVSFFIKIKNVTFSGGNISYLNFLGKGNPKQGYEYLYRVYNSSNSENRNNRLSFYVFNSSGGLGAGSYFQDEKINPDQWVFIAGVLEGDKISIYKNGEFRYSRYLSEYNINLTDTTAPFYISNLNGTIDELRIYTRALNGDEIKTLYKNTLPKYEENYLFN